VAGLLDAAARAAAAYLAAHPGKCPCAWCEHNRRAWPGATARADVRAAKYQAEALSAALTGVLFQEAPAGPDLPATLRALADFAADPPHADDVTAG
jgi:hypothetical protein